MQCVPVQCKAQDQPLECSRAGFLTITRPLADNPCCQETLCSKPCAPAARRGREGTEEGGGHGPPGRQGL